MRNRAVPLVRGVKERFDRKWCEASGTKTPELVRHLGPCWIWSGAKNGEYGRMRIRQTSYPAHRISAALHLPPHDPDLVIDHLCMNKCCVAPHHLEPVSYIENARRYLVREDDAGRTLSTAMAQALQADLRLAAPNPDYAVLAAKYGVTDKHVRKVELGRYWDHARETREVE